MEKEEITELGHEPIPGYSITYYTVITIGIIYLAIVFLQEKLNIQIIKKIIT